MIKLALQHWTLEKCIDIVFGNIQKNFKLPKAGFTNHPLAKRLQVYRITERHKNHYSTYSNCVIMEVCTNSITIKFDFYHCNSLDWTERFGDIYFDDPRLASIAFEDLANWSDD